MAPADDFDAAVGNLVAAIGGRVLLEAPELKLIAQTLQRIVTNAYPSIAAESEDVVEEALVKFTVAVRRGQVDERRAPAAYLTQTAKNEAASRLRSPGRSTALVDEGADDPALYSFIERHAAEADVRAAWLEARRRRDSTAMRVVSAWLDLAAETGTAPSSREVARRAELSHTGVLSALERFRSYLPGNGRHA